MARTSGQDVRAMERTSRPDVRPMERTYAHRPKLFFDFFQDAGGWLWQWDGGVGKQKRNVRVVISTNSLGDFKYFGDDK